jgi:hypothetical protein
MGSVFQFVLAESTFKLLGLLLSLATRQHAQGIFVEIIFILIVAPTWLSLLKAEFQFIFVIEVLLLTER